MDKIFVADSYKNFDQIGEPFVDGKNGKLYVKIQRPCSRCGGLGIIVSHVENGQMIPIPVDSGICYKCGGSKVESKIVRAYTEKEYLRMQKANEKAAERKEKAKAAKIQEYIDNAAEYKHQAALKLGFGEDEKIYIVYGGNTYNIKDQLKEMGARFDPTYKWYFKQEIELPEGYHLCAFSYDELYDYNAETRWSSAKDQESIISCRLAGLYEVPETEFYPGVEGERIRDLEVKVSDIRGFNGFYGYTYIYTFTLDKYVFVWMTSKGNVDFEVGDIVSLTGTIKKFNEYNYIHQTQLSRCIVKEI